MCGIAGFFARHEVAQATSNAMLHALRQRGPDAQHAVRFDPHGGRLSDEHAAAHNALLHARLSIIDPRPISDQPMQNDDGTVWICYNGEVYDWQAHADELIAAGAQFKTRSDTEFILRAYEHWGIDMLPRLRGMFAIVIVDWRIQKVWVVRDRMGLKPLVYYHHNGEFAFGSTVRSVLPFVPRADRSFAADSIDAYLAHRYVPAPRTIFSKLHRLENAHWLCFDLQSRELVKREYWQPSAQSPQQWQETLDTAIKIRTVADRPLGVFLSSGIDSSLVSARLAGMGHHQLGTFTAAFDDPSMDESPLAGEIATKLELPNTAVPVPTSVDDSFDRIIADLDEPFADPSAFPLWYLSRETTNHVKVVLGGDGGDEMFAGYKRFAKHLRTKWRADVSFKANRPKSPTGRGFSRFFDEAAMCWQDAYSLRFSGLTPAQRRFLQPDAVHTPPHYWRQSSSANTASADPLDQLLEIDRLNYLPEYILRKGDLCTMAHGLELRAPLLDHLWVNTVHGMPREQRFTSPAKVLLWGAMPQLHPLDLLHRKKKGFNPPLRQWLRGDLAARLDGMGERLSATTGAQLATNAVDQLVERYRREGQEFLAENVLQLMMLDASLSQLRTLATELPDRSPSGAIVA